MRYHTYDELLENNRRWAREVRSEEPGYFERLGEGQSPPFLLVGCSDSRKPLNTITLTRPGELFIHRNVANQVLPADLNGQAALEFALGALRVRHVIVCGHTRCGGVDAALRGGITGAVGAWLSDLQALAARHRRELEALSDEGRRTDRLAELNVVEQVGNVLRSPAMQEALAEGRAPAVHGWLFRVETGLIDEIALPTRRWREEGLVPAGYGEGSAGDG